jgi:putative FmdB family regulatory protein
MPTYDYVCEACGRALEIFQSMTEAPKKKCPHCGKLKLKRQLGTGGGILFKGSGFYQTDYRSESYKSAAKAEGSTPKESSTPKETPKPASSEGSQKKSPPKSPKSDG